MFMTKLQTDAAPQYLEVIFLGIFTCILLSMLFAAVLWSSRPDAWGLGLEVASGKEHRIPTKELARIEHPMYQGQNEHLHEELLERAWWAEEIARTRMSKILAEVAKRNPPAKKVSVPLSSSSEEEPEEFSAFRDSSMGDGMPFAFLMGLDNPERHNDSPFSSLMGSSGPGPQDPRYPLRPCSVPEAPDERSLSYNTQKSSIGRKLRHPQDKRSRNTRGASNQKV